MIGSGTAGRLLELSNASNPALRINNGNSVADIGIASSAGALLTGAADDDLVIARNGAYGIAIGTNGNTRLALDASGNVNDNSGYLKIGPTDSTADFRLYRNDSSIADGNASGDVKFGGADADNDAAARIRAKADGGDWTATSSPTALEFATCPVGSETLATAMTISSTGAVQIGPDDIQGDAKLGVRRNGDAFNFGHVNGAGYGSNIGCGNNGHPYVAFSCEHGTNNNTFKTRGLLGNVIQATATGELKFSQVTNANMMQFSSRFLLKLVVLFWHFRAISWDSA